MRCSFRPESERLHGGTELFITVSAPLHKTMSGFGRICQSISETLSCRFDLVHQCILNRISRSTCIHKECSKDLSLSEGVVRGVTGLRCCAGLSQRTAHTALILSFDNRMSESAAFSTCGVCPDCTLLNAQTDARRPYVGIDVLSNKHVLQISISIMSAC
jgi:hypothetical protein